MNILHIFLIVCFSILKSPAYCVCICTEFLDLAGNYLVKQHILVFRIVLATRSTSHLNDHLQLALSLVTDEGCGLSGGENRPMTIKGTSTEQSQTVNCWIKKGGLALIN